MSPQIDDDFVTHKGSPAPVLGDMAEHPVFDLGPLAGSRREVAHMDERIISDPHAMAKNIVVCSDGTGNTFAKEASNVSRLTKLLALGRPEEQLVFYDQGIGTHPGLGRSVRSYAAAAEQSRCALQVLQEPRRPVWMPQVLSKMLGLAFDHGLRENVMQMYRALSQHWRSGDKVFLIGFSRGAFTVRALAGLIYRCGLVRPEVAADDACFQRTLSTAFALYEPHEEDTAAVAHFQHEFGAAEACDICFLGLWDTVKSYGGIWPTSLPHLRHNPIVHTVRHALALAEQRSWFVPTSWGGIDGESLERMGVKPDDRYRGQDVQEVWFRGCHCDVGGGDAETATAEVPLQWMLCEAMACGLLLDPSADGLLTEQFPAAATEIHESLRCGWLLAEYVPRWELDNSARPREALLQDRTLGEATHRAVLARREGARASVGASGLRASSRRDVLLTSAPHLAVQAGHLLAAGDSLFKQRATTVVA